MTSTTGLMYYAVNLLVNFILVKFLSPL